jgi:hypothetical protein
MKRVFNNITITMSNEDFDVITLEINGEEHVKGFKGSVSSLKEAYPQIRSVELVGDKVTVITNKDTWGAIVEEFNELNMCFSVSSPIQLLEKIFGAMPTELSDLFASIQADIDKAEEAKAKSK